MMEFDFEKFKSICNDRYIVMHIASENQLKQFIGSACDNNTRWHPLVGDPDARYVYYVRKYADEFGHDHGDVIQPAFMHSKIFLGQHKNLIYLQCWNLWRINKMEDLRKKLKPGDKVILKDARDMTADEDGDDYVAVTLLEAREFEIIEKLEPYSKKLVTVKEVYEGYFTVVEMFEADNDYCFYAGDIAVWTDEVSCIQVNMNDVLEFIGGY